MYSKVITLTEFVLNEEERFPEASGSFTLLMNALSRASKIIGSHVRQAGLVDIIGADNGKVNTTGDIVKKLDTLSNEVLIDVLTGSKQARIIASEEMENEIHLASSGKYSVFFDPLDGSSNIDVNVNIGTIFSIYHADDHMKSGKHQVAAGYIVYGPSTMFVYSSGSGVHGFTFDPSMGSYLLSHPSITIPKSQPIYSFNEAYEKISHPETLEYLKGIKHGDIQYTSRYIGTLVGDIHRTLIKGGIFGYPGNHNKPDGHLRLMYEVNPMSYLVQQAGGIAVSGTQDPLDIEPETLHQRVPIILGSKTEVEKYKSYMPV